MFPQIHTNLNGLVSEFVRCMYQDTKGNYWFGSNARGIIRYDGHQLEKIPLKPQFFSVREIVEDSLGHIWFATSSGLMKYDGEKFTTFSTEAGLANEEIWGLSIDNSGQIWVGSLDGVSIFDGTRFNSVDLPKDRVENPRYMLSDKLIRKFVEDQYGAMWFITDGNGIFKQEGTTFTHLTVKNGLPDNNCSDVMKDSRGNIWIGTYYGGVSKFDGKSFTNYTRDGQIEGEEAYNFCEDLSGNIWFSVENLGVYRYDGTHFTLFTTQDGLCTNGVQNIMVDRKGQLWFTTWQGISIYDGKEFRNARHFESWTN